MGYEQDCDLSETARPAPYLRLQPEAKQEVSWPHDTGHHFAGKSGNIAKSMEASSWENLDMKWYKFM